VSRSRGILSNPTEERKSGEKSKVVISIPSMSNIS